MLKITDQVIVASGDYPLFTAGEDVFSAPLGKNSPTINVLPGQIVVFNPHTGVALNAAQAAALPEFEIAVGVDTNGDGASDELRGVAGKKLIKCGISEINAKAPTCGAPAVQDLLISCVDAGVPYSVKVTAWDTTVRSTHDYNRWAEFVFTREVAAPPCVDCDTADYSNQLACELVDAMNGKKPAGWSVSKNGKFIDSVELPFTATRLFDKSTVYCLTPVEVSDCEDCTAVELLKAISIGDGEAAVVTEFTNAVDPRDDSRTLNAQLDGIVEQINIALGGNGTATLVSSGAPCCPIAIEINTCVDDVALLDDDDEVIEPCDAAYNPLEVDAPHNTCPTCEESEEGTLTYPAGIRVIGRPVKVDLGCYIPDPGDTNIRRDIEIFPYGGFLPGTFHVTDVQSSTNPTNQGWQLIHREYRQELSGPGRNFRSYNSKTGRYGLPLAKDRLNSTLTAQKQSYCVYNMEHTIPNGGTSYHGFRGAPKLRTRFFVPIGDTTTTAALSGVFNALNDELNCVTIAVSCA